MKKTYFALGFIFLASATHAQNDTELKKIALEICPCLTKMLPQKYTNPEVLQLDFGMCYINVAEKYPAVFKKHDINILEMDNQEGAKLGTLMMPYLQAECPAFLDVLYKLEDFYQEDEKQDSFEEMSQ